MKSKFKKCNEDCFHCDRPDCNMPSGMMKSDRFIKEAFKDNKGKSQQKMFTLELGGFGGATPNISRKFYL